ncbi:MAG: FAD-dependent oxidoreductase [Bacteroidota bacterium]
MIDYIIVGQGLAGTLLSHFLEAEGRKVVLIDQYHQSAASAVAAGIINPITGRRYVKSWKIESLLPFAQATYQGLEQLLGVQIYHPRNVLRTLYNHREAADWDIRMEEVAYQNYMLKTVKLGAYEKFTQPAYAYREVRQSAQVKIGNLISAYRKKLLTEDRLIEARFDFDALKLEAQSVAYKNMRATKIIFCEGYQAKQNPFFNYLPFGGTKGEVLIVRIPNVQFEKMLKQRVFIVPLGADLYWIGATNDWNYKDDQPTEAGHQYLSDRLTEVLNIPFEIVSHQAAVRPTVKDRRPFLGLHPAYPQMGIFNGLGTKGASLGPFFAKHFVGFLTQKQALLQEVDIQRFSFESIK